MLRTKADPSLELAVFNISECCQVHSQAKVGSEQTLTIMSCDALVFLHDHLHCPIKTCHAQSEINALFSTIKIILLVTVVL